MPATCHAGVGRMGSQLCRFARKRSGAGQRLRPGDELDPDQKGSIRLNICAFQ
jgi:hypothetical protein